ncbi:MAG TPA: YgjP-like metallopeptidase domain-containing protein, partial [Nitrososphaerales archaeon]|nr:YgjP-like metallopeptidase domain-containing protein [Nitrososphaerales archaeon]
MPVLDLGKRSIGYSVVRGNSRRYTYFRFKPDMTLEIVLPRGRSVDVDRLLRSRLSWVRREFERISWSRSVLTPDSLMLGGVVHPLSFSFGSPETLHIDQTNGGARVVASDRRAVTEAVRRLFLKESSAYVVKGVAELAPKMGVRPSRVDVREIGKWGYCTRSGRISFSW